MSRPLLVLLLLVGSVSVHAQELTRRHPPTRAASIFPAPDSGPDIKKAIIAAMEVKGWGALPTEPRELMDEVGVKIEVCRHITEFSQGNYAYTTTCFLTGKSDGSTYLGEDEEYRAWFAKKWNGKRAALRVLARTGSDIIVEQFHTVLVQGNEAYIWFLYSQKDGCKHPRYWRLVRVTTNGDLTWLGDDMQEAGGQSKDLKGKCINTKKRR